MIRQWLLRRYVRFVSGMISLQLKGREIVIQREGIDFDKGVFSGVSPQETPEGIRFVVLVFCCHGIPATFGIQAKTRSVEFPQIEWDKPRKQFIVRNYDGT